MKTNITHTILVLISKEALKRGFKTELVCDHGEWVLYTYKMGRSTNLRQGLDHCMRIDRNTKIGALEDWMKES